MAKLVCKQCGELNEFDAEFCINCNTFLAWDDAERQVGDERAEHSQESAPAEPDGRSSGIDEQLIKTQVMPRFDVVPDDEPSAEPRRTVSTPLAESDTTEGRFRAMTEQGIVTLPPTGDPVALHITVANTSSIVDGYVVESVEAPSWLMVESNQTNLLPDTEEGLEARLRIASESLVPAQQLRVVLRVRSMSQAPAYADLPVDLTVPVIDAPVRLRAEPRLLRLRDRETGEFTTFVDNSASNRAVRLRFSASDPELAVHFQFRPPELNVDPGGSGSVRVLATAAPPDPGSEVSRILTITALEGTRSVETLVTMQQSTSARVEDPPVKLEIAPSLVRVRDTTVAVVRLMADNRAGREWAHLQLQASDAERMVRVDWALPRLDVPPGGTAHVDARLQAPLPEPGSEISRTVTVTAFNGNRTSTTTATYVQAASASPMATLVIRTDPSVVRVQDGDSAASRVVVDNRRGGFGVRVFLNGTDPERAIRFTFSRPMVEVSAGQSVAVDFRMDASRPRPGQESNRPFTISATDGNATVETSGSFVQTSSRPAIETLSLQLDPSTTRLSLRRRGHLTAVIDNRNGAQPASVSMRGDDPENSLRFVFEPSVLQVPPGRIARTTISVKAPGAPPGQELNRPFTIMASDGQSEVMAEGNIIQAAVERRPFARVLLTLLGGLAMMLGGILPFWSGNIRARDGDEITAADLNANAVARFFASAEIPATNNQGLDALIDLAAQSLSVALIMFILAVVVIFGLTGRSGRLTRFAAFLGAAFVVLVFVAYAIGGINGRVTAWPGEGALLLFVGCILGYVGGLLVRR